MKHVMALFLIVVSLAASGPVVSDAFAQAPSGGAAAGASPDLEIMLVLDNSGSMKQHDPNFLTQEVVTNFLTGFGHKARLGLVVFDQKTRLLEPLSDASKPLNRAKFLQCLEAIDYRGLYSDTPAGIERAIYELRLNGSWQSRKFIILLTDGIIDTGSKIRDVEKTRWLKGTLAEESRRAGIRIFGIAFTDQADFSLIQTLAVRTEGAYFRAYDAADVQQTFDKIDDLIASSVDAGPPPAAAPEPSQVTVDASPPPAAESAPPPPAEEKPRSDSAVRTKGAVGPARQEGSPPAVQRLLPNVILGGIFLLLTALVILTLRNRKSRPPMPPPAAERAVQAASMHRAELIDVKNITGQKVLFLNKRIVKIGRDTINDITIPDKTISSLHAVVEFKDGFFYLEDQRSKNRTILNGRELEPYVARKLKSGDDIVFNNHKFKFIMPDLIPSGQTALDVQHSGDTVVEGAPGLVPEADMPMPQAMLVDVKNITRQKTFVLHKKMMKIGRGLHNDIVIGENSISASHATISYKDGFFYLEDQRSTNNTRLNGVEVAPYRQSRLKSGDEISFDVYKFIFLLERHLPTGDTGERWTQ